MANQGIYREPGAASGLPLPRARIMPLTIVVVLLALVALTLPPLLLVLAGGSTAGAWRLFRDGGMSMWLLLLLDLAAPVVIAALGAFVLRGKRVPSGLLFGAAALPFGVALLGAWSGQRVTMGALMGESVDPETKARILAEGIAESMSVDIFGGLVVCGAALVATAAASFAVASIDVTTITRGGPKPPSLGTFGPAAAGALWVLATMVLGVVRLRVAGGLTLLPVLPLFVVVPCAILAGRSSSVLRAWHDRAEASRGAGALVIAMLSALLALFALQRGIESGFTARALSAISGESVDPSQRARILGQAIESGHLAPAAYAIHVVFGTATFALALVPALGNGRHPLTASAAIAGAIALVLLGSTFALSHSRSAAPAAMLAHSAGAPGGVTLPVIVGTFSERSAGAAGGERIIVAKDGTGDGDLSKTTSCSGGSRATVFADAAATLAMVVARFPQARVCQTRLVLVATRNHPPEIDARLGAYAGYLGTTAYFAATLDDVRSTNDGETLRVRSASDDAIEIDGVRIALPAPASAAADVARGSHISRIAYSLRPTDTVEHSIRTMLAVEALLEGRVSTWSLERVIAVDDGTARAVPSGTSFAQNIGDSLGSAGVVGGSKPPSIRAGAVQVNGRLPPEVIQRIVRQNFGRLRLCYETGLRKAPDLHGRVAVKFVIDRAGSVTSAADGGSDLPDATVVACIVRAFGSLSFPQPEGGIVTVVYPFVFTPS